MPSHMCFRGRSAMTSPSIFALIGLPVVSRSGGSLNFRGLDISKTEKTLISAFLAIFVFEIVKTKHSPQLRNRWAFNQDGHLFPPFPFLLSSCLSYRTVTCYKVFEPRSIVQGHRLSPSLRKRSASPAPVLVPFSTNIPRWLRLKP